MALFIVREGEGEEEALPSLVNRLRAHVGLDSLPHASVRKSFRKPLLNERQVADVCGQARGLGSCEALLLTRDADNDHLADRDCPKTVAPRIGEWVRSLALPFPVAVVLFYKEYETLFLAAAGGMAGRPVRNHSGAMIASIPTDIEAHPNPEHLRGAKEWVGQRLLPGYKQTLHQASLTRLLDFESPVLRSLSSYRRLVSGLRFLAENLGRSGAVYPPGPEVPDHG